MCNVMFWKSVFFSFFVVIVVSLSFESLYNKENGSYQIMISFRCMIKKLNIVEFIQKQKQGGYKTDMLFLSINYKVNFFIF